MQLPSETRPWLRHYDYWVPETMNFPRRSLFEILRTTAAERPDLPATAFLGAQLTFGEIKHRVERFATALSALGVRKGDRVGIMLPNCPQYVIGVFAVVRLGAVVVNINPSYTAREVSFAAGDSGIRYLLTLDTLAANALAACGATALETIIVSSMGEYSAAAAECPRVDGTLRMCDLLEQTPIADLPRVVIDTDNDLAVLQYTGGTTGVPKAAMLTHGNIFANVVQMQMWMRQSLIRGDDRYLLVIPYFHIYGLTVGLMLGTWIGALQIQIPKYDVEAVLAAIRDFRPTYFPAVPTIFVSLLNHPKLREFGLDKVRTFNSGAAPLPVEVLERFERAIGVTLNEGYGLSEASPVTHSTASLATRKPGSIGLPMPGTLIKVVDLETGTRELPIGEEGEMCISGPQVMKGYWNKPEETAIALRTHPDGRTWLHTGDVARLDEDGYSYIVQRKKDMIIVDGFNVYPSEVESVLYAHGAVMECAVVGVPHDYHGEVVKAVVVLKPGATASPDELCEHCKTSLTEYKRPRHVDIRPTLPKSAVGKILYTVLREEARTAQRERVS